MISVSVMMKTCCRTLPSIKGSEKKKMSFAGEPSVIRRTLLFMEKIVA
jgi:hypothetical protein